MRARPSPRRSSCRRPPRRGGEARGCRSSRCTSRGVAGRPRGPRGPGCSPRCSRWQTPACDPGPSLRRLAPAPACPSRGPSGQPLIEPAELLVAVVLDHDAATAARARNAHLRPERAAELLLDALPIGIRRRCATSIDVEPVPRLPNSPDELLGLTNRQRLIEDRREDAPLTLKCDPAYRARMALRDRPVGEGHLNGGIEVEQPQRIRDRDARA